MSSTRLARLIVTTGALVLGAIAGAATAVAEPMHVLPAGNRTFEVPPTTAFCQQNFAINCCQPFQLTRAYELNSLHASGVDGRGETIVIRLGFIPTKPVAASIGARRYHLPARATLRLRVSGGGVFEVDASRGSDEAGYLAHLRIAG